MKKKKSDFKKITSPVNEFLVHKCRNDEKILKCIFFFKFETKNTSPANEFLLHKCRNNEKILRCVFFEFKKKTQVQLMSLSYINVEAIGKY